MGRPQKIFAFILTFHVAFQKISISSPSSSCPTLLLFADAAPTTSLDEEERKRRRKERRREERRQEKAKQQQHYDQYASQNSNYDNNNKEEGEGDTTTTFGSSTSINTLFITHKPRDVIEGIKSALSNTLRGTFYGVTALIASPIGGLKFGVGGAIAGLVTGVLLGIIMPIVGFTMGSYQIIRGFIATPEAIVDGFFHSKVYDETKREWVEYRLEEDIIEINDLLKIEQKKEKMKGSGSSDNTNKRDSSSRRRRVKSTEYYDLLDIQTDASPSEIRSAYRKKARVVHPDKNPNDPNAQEKFRMLSAAYQTLSDPSKRNKYDSSGIGMNPETPEGNDGSSIMVDPLIFFALMFGSEQVEPYIGELGMATTFDALLKLGNTNRSWEDVKTTFGWNEAALKRRKRETDIALHLRKRVSDYVEGYLTLGAYKDGCFEEAVRIAKGGSYGASFLLAIGPSLIAEADAFLGYRSSVLGSWRGPIGNARRNMLFLRRKFAVGKSILRTISHSLKALYESAEVTPNDDITTNTNHQQRRGSRQQQQRHERNRFDKNNTKRRRRKSDNNNRVDFDKELLKDNLSNTIPTVLEMAWAINFVDISNTLYGACYKLFHDADIVSWEERLRIAEALHILGSQFYVVGLEVSGGNTTLTPGNVDDIKAQANAAFMESLKKGREESNDEM